MVKPLPPRETDLYPTLKTWLADQGYTVRSEVAHCDVVARRGDELLVIELKRQLSVDLLIQAVERQRRVASVYLAVPDSKSIPSRWKGLRRLLRRLELGLLVVDPEARHTKVRVWLHPGPYEARRQHRFVRALLSEVEGRTGDYNAGGSTGRKLVTAYREAAIHIACCLALRGAMTPRALRAAGTGPKTSGILYDNVYGWFRRTQRGIYELSDGGRRGLEAFSQVAAKYRESMQATMEECDPGGPNQPTEVLGTPGR